MHETWIAYEDKGLDELEMHRQAISLNKRFCSVPEVTRLRWKLSVRSGRSQDHLYGDVIGID